MLQRPRWTLFLSIVCGVLIATPVAAQQSAMELADQLIPGEGDASMRILVEMFGPIVSVVTDYPEGATETLLTAALATVTALVLGIAGVLLTYTLVAGTAQTAHQGEALGGWSSMWVPIRTVIGVGMVIPLPALSGLSSVQAVVIFITALGAGVANTTWTESVEASVERPLVGTVPAPVQRPASGEIGAAILRNEVCMASINMALETAGYEPPITLSHVDIPPEVGVWQRLQFWDSEPAAGARPGVTRRVVTWGGGSYKPDVCGEVSYPIMTNPDPDDEDGSTVAILDAIQRQNSDAMNTLITHMREIAANIVYDESAGDAEATAYQTAVTEYSNAVMNAARGAYQQNDAGALSAVQEQATADGWAFAGAWFWRLAEQQEQVTRGVRSVAEGFESRQSAERYLPRELEITVFGDEARAEALLDRVVSTSGVAAEAERIRRSDDGGDLLARLMRNVGAALTSIDADENQNPILTYKGVGDTVISAASLGVLAGGGLAAFSPIGGTIIAFSTAVFVLGWLLAIYLPFLPFLLWTVGVMSWVIHVTLAMLSTPVWAIMHLNPGGDGLAGGRASSGYFLLLSLVMRPPLMILGLVAATALLYVLSWMLEQTLWQSMVVGGFTGFWDAIGTLALYVLTAVITTRLALSLISTAPDTILAWMSGLVQNSTQIQQPEAESEMKTTGPVVGAGLAGAAGVAGGVAGMGREPQGNPGGQTPRNEDLIR